MATAWWPAFLPILLLVSPAMAVQVEMEFAAPPEEIFHLLEDDDARMRWMKAIVEVRDREPGPGGAKVGTRYVERIREGINYRDYQCEVLAHEAPSLLETTLGNEKFRIRLRYELYPSPTGTRLSHKITTESYTILSKIMSFFGQKMLREITKRQLENLRRVAEGTEDQPFAGSDIG